MVAATIRALSSSDLPKLERLDANYVADAVLAVEREQQGLSVTFRLTEQPRQFAYVKRVGYSFGSSYQHDLRRRINAAQGLYLAALCDEQLVGFLDVEPESWRPAALMQWLVVDRPWRGQGIGRALVEYAVEWTRRSGLRALVLETQNTNIDACRFYFKTGFRLSGVQDLFYFDQQVAEERAIFWVYEV